MDSRRLSLRRRAPRGWPRRRGGSPDRRYQGLEGRGDVDGLRVESMADLLVRARKLLDGDGMAGATVDAGKGELFCTGSGRSVAVSDSAIRRARALVGEEAEEACVKKRRQSFGDVADVEGEMDVSFRGAVHKDITPPVFQTGSGKAVLLGKHSIQKARAILEDVDRTAGAVQPMFRTGMGRPVPVSRTSIDKARAVLVGQTLAEQGAEGTEQFPLFQTGSGRVVSISVASVLKAKSVLKDNNTSNENMESFGWPDQPMMFQTDSRRPVVISGRSIERSRGAAKEGNTENSGHWDTDCQFPMFQTGLGKPVAVSRSSVQKARAVLEGGKHNTSGHEDNGVCATTFQTETPRSVLLSVSSIMSDRTVTLNGDSSMQEKTQEDGNRLPLFQTGLGRSIAISKSSVKRASAILEPRNIAKELEDEAHLDCGHAIPVFKTGLGRSTLGSENSGKKVPVILEAEEAVKAV